MPTRYATVAYRQRFFALGLVRTLSEGFWACLARRLRQRAITAALATSDGRTQLAGLTRDLRCRITAEIVDLFIVSA